MQDHRLLADALALDITEGRLTAGAQLPPQREFARQHRIASSTAARVYAALTRRGLVVGEVGRGTFVRAAGPIELALAEPGGAGIDLDLNFPLLPEQPALLARSLEKLLRPDSLAACLQPVGVSGTAAARSAAAQLLRHNGWSPEASSILFAGNGRQAIAAAIAALVPRGERLGVEAMTYPLVKALAARLGVTLVPLAMDENGVSPGAVLAAHRAAPLRAIYLQPTLHNPLGTTMPIERRYEIAGLMRRLDLWTIEDAIYSFLNAEPPPLAALAPERTLLIDSLSKRLSPGLTLGFAATPAGATERVATALRSGAWAAARFALEAGTRWIADGTAAAIAEGKRADAAARQGIARQRLSGFVIRADPRAYHCWWELPEPWRAETFVAAAARRGIAITPAAAFAVVPGHAPNAVRLALASPAHATLASALGVLAALARATPEDARTE